jgi:hypothetical protein
MRLQLRDSETNLVAHLSTNSLKSTFEECLIEVEDKFQAYCSQVEEYRRDCIDGMVETISLYGI